MKWIFLLVLSLSTAAVAQVTPAPIFSPASGTFTDVGSVTVDAAPQVSLVCTTNGSTPTASNGFNCEAEAAVTFISTTTLKAIAIPVLCNGPCIPSAVTSQVYTVTYTPVTTPTLSPASGTFTTSTGSLEVTINEPSPDGIIHYTLDGSTPSATNGTSLSVNGGIVVIPGGTLKAIAILPNGVSSPVATGTYTVFAQQTPLSVPLPPWSIGAFGAALIGVMVRRRRVS